MTDNTLERPTFGNWILARTQGLSSLGLLATIVLFIGLTATLICIPTLGLVGALPVAAAFAVLFVAVGTPAGAWVLRVATFGLRKVRGGTVHQAGVMSSNPDPTSTLPALLAKVTMLTAPSGFAVLRRGTLYTMVARCLAEGPSLQDQGQVDTWVARWEALLSAFGQEAGLVCVKAVTDTAPDPGGRIPAMVAAHRSPHSPALARQVMDEVAATSAAAASEVPTYLELTYRGRDLNRRNNQDAILAELDRRARALVPVAQYAGGGNVRMMTEPELARLVRLAYDPDVAATVEQERLTRTKLPALTWRGAGPMGAREQWGEMVHDSGRSVSWAMTEAPRGLITEHALAHILAPHADFARKRVALILRPYNPGDSTRVADRDVRHANTTVRSGKRDPSALQQKVQVAAAKSAQEVAAGAAAVRFSIMITGTVLHDGDLEQAVSTLENRARAVPLRLRRMVGDQAAAFAVTLPVGLVPWEMSAVPTWLRNLL